MISLVIATIPLALSTSPINISFFLVIISISSGVLILLSNSSALAPAAIIISFSSGIIIIFCYCSILSIHEKNSISLNTPLLLATLPAVLNLSEQESDLTQLTELSIPCCTFFLIVAIIVVILSLISVNNSMFHPNNASITSY